MSANGKTIRIAFVGAGIVAGPYGKAVPRIPNLEFAGAYDPESGRAEAVVKSLGGRVYKELEEILGDKTVDAAIVMTPNKFHVETALRLMESGKHVLVEKPIASTIGEIDHLEEAARKAGRVCMPAHNYIYAPALQRARRLVEEGAFGQVASAWILYNLFHSEELAERYGGVLREVCVHHAYSIVYLLGRPRRVSAVASRVHYEKLTCEDQVMVTCELPNNALAHLWASFAASDPTSDPWTVVYKILGTKGGTCYTWNEGQFQNDGGPGWGIPSYMESFAEELDFFVNRAISRGDTPLSTLDHARDAISIIRAAEESIEGNKGLVEVQYAN
ncbi:MAG: Gfo/Idh/MocA family oxidoreductase [Candidatus Sumerlaeia bacterium]|nr:Gfo/Idh/MocA family oxidoreductase [Candidatus Sumerlaeia bacterium]